MQESSARIPRSAGLHLCCHRDMDDGASFDDAWPQSDCLYESGDNYLIDCIQPGPPHGAVYLDTIDADNGAQGNLSAQLAEGQDNSCINVGPSETDNPKLEASNYFVENEGSEQAGSSAWETQHCLQAASSAWVTQHSLQAATASYSVSETQHFLQAASSAWETQPSLQAATASYSVSETQPFLQAATASYSASKTQQSMQTAICLPADAKKPRQHIFSIPFTMLQQQLYLVEQYRDNCLGNCMTMFNKVNGILQLVYYKPGIAIATISLPAIFGPDWHTYIQTNQNDVQELLKKVILDEVNNVLNALHCFMPIIIEAIGSKLEDMVKKGSFPCKAIESLFKHFNTEKAGQDSPKTKADTQIFEVSHDFEHITWCLGDFRKSISSKTLNNMCIEFYSTLQQGDKNNIAENYDKFVNDGFQKFNFKNRFTDKNDEWNNRRSKCPLIKIFRIFINRIMALHRYSKMSQHACSAGSMTASTNSNIYHHDQQGIFSDAQSQIKNKSAVAVINAPSPPENDPLAVVSNFAVAQDALLNMCPAIFSQDTTADAAAADEHAGTTEAAADDEHDEHAGTTEAAADDEHDEHAGTTDAAADDEHAGTTDAAADDEHAGEQGEKYAADDDEHAGGQGGQYIAQRQLLISLRETLLQQRLERNKRTDHEYSCEKLEENEDANKTENGNKKQRTD